MKKVIATTNAPAAIGPYSQAIQVGNMLFASGQLGIDPATGNFVEGAVKEQTAQAFKNVKAILTEAGLEGTDRSELRYFHHAVADSQVIHRNSFILCSHYDSNRTVIFDRSIVLVSFFAGCIDLDA